MAITILYKDVPDFLCRKRLEEAIREGLGPFPGDFTVQIVKRSPGPSWTMRVYGPDEGDKEPALDARCRCVS